jgi:hypothetical protein
VTALIVYVPIEREPVIVIDALSDGEEARLQDWLRWSLVLTRAAADLLQLQRELVEAEGDKPEAA